MGVQTQTHMHAHREHEEMEWQNSMLLQISQIQDDDLIQEENVPPLATSLPTALLSKISLLLEWISEEIK